MAQSGLHVESGRQRSRCSDGRCRETGRLMFKLLASPLADHEGARRSCASWRRRRTTVFPPGALEWLAVPSGPFPAPRSSQTLPRGARHHSPRNVALLHLQGPSGSIDGSTATSIGRDSGLCASARTSADTVAMWEAPPTTGPRSDRTASAGSAGICGDPLKLALLNVRRLFGKPRLCLASLIDSPSAKDVGTESAICTL